MWLKTFSLIYRDSSTYLRTGHCVSSRSILFISKHASVHFGSDRKTIFSFNLVWELNHMHTFLLPGCDFMVQSPRDPLGLTEIRSASRYLEHWLHFCRDGDQTSAFPRGLRDWPDLQDIQVWHFIVSRPVSVPEMNFASHGSKKKGLYTQPSSSQCLNPCLVTVLQDA